VSGAADVELSDEDLRAMVREAIGRLGAGGRVGSLPGPADLQSAAPSAHASHARLPVLGGESGACLIEPAVTCVHCGYCQSYGH
jgi:hypothetical protein